MNEEQKETIESGVDVSLPTGVVTADVQLWQVPVDTAQAVVNYLGTKPYAEVAGLIEAFKGGKLVS